MIIARSAFYEDGFTLALVIVCIATISGCFEIRLEQSRNLLGSSKGLSIIFITHLLFAIGLLNKLNSNSFELKVFLEAFCEKNYFFGIPKVERKMTQSRALRRFQDRFLWPGIMVFEVQEWFLIGLILRGELRVK